MQALWREQTTGRFPSRRGRRRSKDHRQAVCCRRAIRDAGRAKGSPETPATVRPLWENYVPHHQTDAQSRFCSKSCATIYHARRRPRPSRTCLRCGVVFAIRLPDGSRSQKKLCATCGATKSRGGTSEFTCEVCGKMFRIFHAQVRKGGGRFCSRTCARPLSHYDPTGACRYALHGQNWPAQAREARERDDHTCQDCGLRQEHLAQHVHHSRPRKAFGRDYVAANDLGNLVTRCASCHPRRETALRRERRARLVHGSR